MKIHYFPPLGVLRSVPPGDDSPAAVVHRCYTGELWRERGPLRRLGIAVALLGWPLMALALAVRATVRNGAAVRRRTGRGWLAQLGDQLRLAAVHDVWPPWYYVFELYEAEHRARAGDYILKHEMFRNVYPFLRERLRTGAPGSLVNKLRFYRHCRQAGLPVVPVWLTIDSNGFEWEPEHAPPGDAAAVLPECDLFAKPVDDKSGRGAECWRNLGGDRYRGAGGRVLSSAQLIAHLGSRCRTLPRSPRYLLQPRLVGHPAIADLSGDVLATVRVLTCLDEHGGFECTHAVFKMAATADAVVDNFHAGGIATRVDLASGELGAATDLGFRPGRGWVDAHPRSGATLPGRKLPHWDEVVALARRAHAAFPDRILVGWDIAILPEGPVLVEGQGSSDLDFIQRTHQQPLGASRCGELLAFHVRRALAAPGPGTPVGRSGAGSPEPSFPEGV